MLVGTVSRRCIKDHESEEFFGCFKEDFRMLLDEVISYSLVNHYSIHRN